MKFGDKKKKIHDDFEQIKRITFTQRIKPENIKLNETNQTAKLYGSSGIYDVTLNSCTCYDFESRNLPCKHIYKLALDLGFFSIPEKNKKLAKEFKNSVPLEIERFKEFYLSGAISGEKLNKIVNALISK